jgi:hypothetical protein
MGMVLGGTILGFMNLCSIVCICIAKICYMGWGSTGPAVSRVLVGGFDLVLVASVANIRIYGLCHACGAICYVVDRVHRVGSSRTRMGNMVSKQDACALEYLQGLVIFWARPRCVTRAQGLRYLP